MSSMIDGEPVEVYFKRLHDESLALKASKVEAKESAVDFDGIVVLEESEEVADLATLPHAGSSKLSPKTLALAAVERGWEVRASKNLSLVKGRTASTGRVYADKKLKNTWMEGRIESKPFAFRAHWTGTSFEGASCWGVQDAAFIWPKGTIEKSVKYLDDAEQFAHFVHFKGLFMNVEQIKDMNDKRETAKVMKRIAKQEKDRATKGGVDVVAGA